jgi:hypothetical protein
MAPEFAHVVQVEDDSWDVNYLHPVAWCKQNATRFTWTFHVDFHSKDPLSAEDIYVFSFEDIHTATQFALLYA